MNIHSSKAKGSEKKWQLLSIDDHTRFNLVLELERGDTPRKLPVKLPLLPFTRFPPCAITYPVEVSSRASDQWRTVGKNRLTFIPCRVEWRMMVKEKPNQRIGKRGT